MCPPPALNRVKDDWSVARYNPGPFIWENEPTTTPSRAKGKEEENYEQRKVVGT